MSNPRTVDSCVGVARPFEYAGNPEPLAHPLPIAIQHGHFNLDGFSLYNPIACLDTGVVYDWDFGVMGRTEGAHQCLDVRVEEGHHTGACIVQEWELLPGFQLLVDMEQTLLWNRALYGSHFVSTYHHS